MTTIFKIKQISLITTELFKAGSESIFVKSFPTKYFLDPVYSKRMRWLKEIRKISVRLLRITLQVFYAEKASIITT